MRFVIAILLVAAGCGGGNSPSADAAKADDAPMPNDVPDAMPSPFTHLIVADHVTSVLWVFDILASGDATPVRTISGPATGLANPYGIGFVEPYQEIISANLSAPTVTAHAFTAAGDAAPLRTIASTAAAPTDVSGIAYDPVTDEIFACSEGGSADIGGVTVWERAGSANRKRTIVGAATTHANCNGVIVDAVARELFVMNGGGSSVLVFDLAADGDVAPKRSISGSATGLGYPSRGSIDRVHGELLVADEGPSSAVLVFALDASGDAAPLRTLAIDATPFADPVDVVHDPTTDEIFVADGSGAIYVFHRTDQGTMVAPRRTLAATTAGFDTPSSIVLAR